MSEAELKAGIFREYDIRGIADKELTSDGVEALGRALATYIIRQSGRTISLGRDCRLSGERLHDALLKGLLASGADVLDLGIVPTPVLYFSAVHFQTNGAVMITGSHNPPEYNGFKTVCGATTLYGDAIRHIYQLTQTRDYESGAGTCRCVDAVAPYIDDISSRFAFEGPINVVFDAGNGTAGPVVHRVLKRLGVEATELFFDMDGRFPNHHPDPTVLPNLRSLQEAVREHRADLGIAFDGDADRIGAVDERGQVVYPDMLLLIFGREILSRKPGATFIGDVKCSHILYDKLRELGGNAIMYKTGHSLMKAKMKEAHAELAGELSGHMFFSDRYYGYDDAIYAACRLMEIVSRPGKPLSHQLAGVPKLFSTPELHLDCADDAKFRLIGKVAEIVAKQRRIIDIDGVRVPFERGWGLVRASNTQPVLVLRFEAETEELLGEYRREIEEAVAQAKRELGV